MEIKLYLRMLQRSWWIVLITILAAVIVALVAAYFSTPIYQASARFIVAPNSMLINGGANVVDSLATLDKRSIITTYAEILNSSRIYKETTDLLNLDMQDLELYKHTTVVLPNANILELAVEGTDPTTVATLANSVGQRAVAYAQGFYQVYDLSILDPAVVPAAPIRPQPLRDAGIAVVLGLVIGAVLAIFREVLRTPLQSFAQKSALDSASYALSRRTFDRRLDEATVNMVSSLSLCLVDLEGLKNYIEALPQPILQDVLRHVTQTLKNQLRGNDLVGRWNDTGFAVMLSETPGKAALNTMERVRNALSEPILIDVSDEKLQLEPLIGIAEHKAGDTTGALVNNAELALERAAQAPNRIYQA
jgi:diguanylate cyclase (GGDEF)-like protein